MARFFFAKFAKINSPSIFRFYFLSHIHNPGLLGTRDYYQPHISIWMNCSPVLTFWLRKTAANNHLSLKMISDVLTDSAVTPTLANTSSNLFSSSHQIVFLHSRYWQQTGGLFTSALLWPDTTSISISPSGPISSTPPLYLSCLLPPQHTSFISLPVA